MKRLSLFKLILLLFPLLSFSQVAKLGEVTDNSGTPTVFSLNNGNQYLAIGNNVGVLSVFDGNSFSESFKIRPHDAAIRFLDFYESQQEVITANSSKIVFTKLSDGSQSSEISIFRDIDHLKVDPAKEQMYIVARLNKEEATAKKVFKIDLKSRRYTEVYSGAGIDDFVLNGNGELMYISKGTKVFKFNTNISIVEGNIKLETPSANIDFNPLHEDWLVTNDKAIVRYWKISAEKSYELRWDPLGNLSELSRIDQAWVLNEEGKLLLHGLSGLKTRTVTNPNGDVSIKSISGKKISKVALSKDRTKVLFTADSKVVEIWSLGGEGATATTPTNTVAANTGSTSNNFNIDSDDDIYTKYKQQIDDELNLRSDLFEPRGEFEKSSDYDSRVAEANAFKQKVLDYYRGVANRDADVAREIELAKQKIITERQREDSLRKAALYKDKIFGSYEEFFTRISEVGTYNPDKEEFPITIDGETRIVRVPFDKARDFKEGHLYFKVVGMKQYKLDGVTMDQFNYKIITDQGDVYDFGPQRKPLYVADDFKLLDASLSKRSVATEQPQTLPANTIPSVSSNSSGIDNAIVKYFKKKSYHALLIGVNEYADPRITQLDQPIDDATRLKDVLSNQYTFDEANIRFLQNPTRTEIIETFDKLQQEISEEDNLLIFYAGHGIWDENLKQGFWLPSDSKIDSKAAWLSNAMIRDYIRGINTKHTLLVADACFSGGIFKTREVFIENRASLELAKLPSRKAITSGAMKTVPDKSVFLEYLIKRLEQNQNPLLPTEQLFSSFKIAVMNNSQGQVPQYGDIQGAGDEGGDFVFLRRGN